MMITFIGNGANMLFHVTDCVSFKRESDSQLICHNIDLGHESLEI